jgi:hypothetical protein
MESLIDRILQSNGVYCNIRNLLPSIYRSIDSEVRQKLLLYLEASDRQDELDTFIKDFPYFGMSNIGVAVDDIQKNLLNTAVTTLFRDFFLDDVLKTAIYQYIDILANRVKVIATNIGTERLFPPIDEGYSSACHELFHAIWLSERISRRDKKYYFFNTSEDLLFICRKTVTFNYQQIMVQTQENSRFLIWLNKCANKIFLRALKEWNKNNIKSDEQLYPNEIIPEPEPVEERKISSEELKYLIEEDITGIFINTCIPNNPNVNFKIVALLLFEEIPLTRIAQQLKVTHPQLNHYYRQWIKQLRPFFIKHL